MTNQWELGQLFKKLSLEGVQNYRNRQWIFLQFQSYLKVDDKWLQIRIHPPIPSESFVTFKV